MKISYVLLNRTGKARKVPAGEAWQWMHEVEDERQMMRVFSQLKKTIRVCRLTLANLHLEPRNCSDEFPEMATFTYKGPILYDEGIAPKRIFHVHEDSFEDHDIEALH